MLGACGTKECRLILCLCMLSALLALLQGIRDAQLARQQMSGPGGAGTGAGSAAGSYVNQQVPAYVPAGAGSMHGGASVSGASLTSFQQVSLSCRCS